METEKQIKELKSIIYSLIVIVAILIIVVAGSILINYSKNAGLSIESLTEQKIEEIITIDTKKELTYGNKNAEIVLIEYSDLGCIYCSRQHVEAKKAVDESNGELLWVYRHLAFRAPAGAIISECIKKEVGNNEAFSYLDLIFEAFGAATTDKYYKDVALANFNISNEEIDACLKDSDIADILSTSEKNATQFLNFTGTPGIIFINRKTDAKILIPGFIEYKDIKSVVDSLKE